MTWYGGAGHGHTFGRKDDRIIRPRRIAHAKDLRQTLACLAQHRRHVSRDALLDADADVLDEDVRDESGQLVSDEEVESLLRLILEDSIERGPRGVFCEFVLLDRLEGFGDGVGVLDGAHSFERVKIVYQDRD